jgi:hypothetical protein
MVSIEQWQTAQIAERQFHNEDFQTGFDHYGISYANYFKWLDIDPDLKGKKVVEIGPADFPALAYCRNIGESFIIEPMPSEYLKRFNIPIITDMAEDSEYKADEVWLFNVLQHVIDPHKIVERAKRQSKVIRFFEPINYGVNECHPWNLTMQMFKDWFGEVNHYPFNNNAVQFHTWECAYGKYERVQ